MSPPGNFDSPSSPSSGPSPAPEVAEQALIGQLLAQFESPRYRPPTLPTVALELLQVTQRAEVDVKALVGLLERDPMLAAQVLKLVRSAAYAGRMPLTSLREAVVRLGMARLRDVVMEASLSLQVFRGDGVSENMERLRVHSSMSGHLSRLVCRYTPINPEFAFLCGLLHDIGIVGALNVLGKPGSSESLAAAWPVIGRVHPVASAIICKLWKLPTEIEQVVGVHHEWNAEGTTNPLGAVVCIAEALAAEHGFGFVPAEAGAPGGGTAALSNIDRTAPEIVAQAFDLLEIDPAKRAQLTEETRVACAEFAPRSATSEPTAD